MDGAFGAVNSRLLHIQSIKSSDFEKSVFDLTKSVPQTTDFHHLGTNELYHGFCYDEKASYIVSEVDGNTPLKLEDVITEISILKNLQHTSIPSFKGVWLKQTSPTSYRLFTAINQCKLGSLRSLQREFDLTWTHQMQIMEDISGALAHLHKNEILHRSMLSTNIIVSEKWTAFLTGFTRACHVNFEGRNDRRNLDPEDPVNDLPTTEDYGTHTDIFGLGVILMEMMLDGDELPENTPIALQHIASQCTRMEATERISATALHERVKGLHEVEDGKEVIIASGRGSPRPMSTSSLPPMNGDLKAALLAEQLKLKETDEPVSESTVESKTTSMPTPTEKELYVVQEGEEDEDQLANFDFNGDNDNQNEVVKENSSSVIAEPVVDSDEQEENDFIIEIDGRIQAVEQAIEQLGEETSLHAAVQEKLIYQVQALRAEADERTEKEKTEESDDKNTQVIIQGMSNRISTLETRLEEQTVTQTRILARIEEILNKPPVTLVKPVVPVVEQNKTEESTSSGSRSTPKKQDEELDNDTKLVLQRVVQPLMEDMKNIKGAMKEILDSPVMKRSGQDSDANTSSPAMSNNHNNNNNISVNTVQQIAHTLVELLSKATSVIKDSQGSTDNTNNTNNLGNSVGSSGAQMLWSEIDSPITDQVYQQQQQQQQQQLFNTAPAGSIAQTYQPFASIEEDDEKYDAFEFGEHTHVPMSMNSPGSEAQLASSYSPYTKRMSMAASMAANRNFSSQKGFGLPDSPRRNQVPHKAAGSFYGTLPMSQMPKSFSKPTVRTYSPQQYLTVAGKAAGPALQNNALRKTVLDNQKIRKEDTIAFTASAGKVSPVKPVNTDSGNNNKSVPHFAQKTNAMARKRASFLQSTGQLPKSRDASFIGSKSVGKQGTFIAKSKKTNPQDKGGVSFNQTRRMSLFHYVNAADTAKFLK